MSGVTDGKDGHGLKLEKVVPTFSCFNARLEKSPKTFLWFVLHGDICLKSSFITLLRILCVVKVLSNALSTELNSISNILNT